MIHRESWARKIIVGVSLLAGCSAASLARDTITGVVRNQTRSQFAAGDEVILLRLDRGMHEEAHTKADPQGSFTLPVQYPDKLHLVRVLHQGVNYDQRVAPGDNVSIDVFDTAAKVQGVSGSIEIIRTGTNGNLLHVSDMVELRNDSNPALTQAGERTFEVYLPAHAKIDSVLAAGPGKIGVMISATSVPGEPGHYTVNFPLRPGATKFAFNYDLPYLGRRATFFTRHVYPLQQLVVMLPPTMKFTPQSSAFQILPTGNNSYQVEAANLVKAGDGPGFEISGVGALPALQAQAQASPKRQVSTLPSPAFASSGNSLAQAQSAKALSTGIASGISAPSSRLPWWVPVVGALLIFGTGGFLLWRRERLSATAMMTAVRKTEPSGQTSASPVEVLKEELSQLEIERMHGTISVEEYDSAKQALEGTVKRALARAGANT
jgi:hypothetical protein